MIRINQDFAYGFKLSEIWLRDKNRWSQERLLQESRSFSKRSLNIRDLLKIHATRSNLLLKLMVKVEKTLMVKIMDMKNQNSWNILGYIFFFSKLGSSLMAQLLWNFKASKTVSIQFRPFSNTRSKLDYGFKTNYAEIYANDCPEDECQLQKTEKQKQIDQQKVEKEKEAQRCKLKEYTASNIMVWKIYHINWNFKKENYGWKKHIKNSLMIFSWNSPRNLRSKSLN